MAFKRGRRGKKPMIPKAIANAPQLRPDLVLYDIAFSELRRGTPREQPIAFESLWAWCNARELDEEGRQDFLEIIPQMDLFFLKWVEDNKPRGGGNG